MRAIPTIALGAVLGLAGVASPANADGGGNTIGDIVIEISGAEGFDDNAHDYDILREALVATDLVDAVFDEDADLTVFAPKDKAFLRLARDFGYEGNDEAEALGAILDKLEDIAGGDPIPLLTSVVKYHVAGESITAFQFILRSIFRQPVTTISDVPDPTFQPFFFRLKDNDPDFRDPRLNFPINVRASNGIIHTINRVLIPADL